MIPPLVALMENTTSVTDVLGSDPTRFFLSRYPQALPVTYPYAVYQTVSGAPNNMLSEAPEMDNVRVQIDIYSDLLLTARTAFNAVRDAVETVSYIVVYTIAGQFDPATDTYRYSFDISYWLPRSEG